MFILTFDLPGQRASKYYLETKSEAFTLAARYLLSKGMVTIFDPEGKEIYRHTQPFTREKYKESVHA